MSETIQFMDLKGQYSQIRDEVITKLGEVCETTAFSGGAFVEKFEANFAAYCSTKYAIALNSGTSALHLAVAALGIVAGDEVIIPANTFIATAWAASYVNAVPKFVDCLPGTWNIDARAAERAITPKTKAIIGVHLYGQPFDIDSVSAVAKAYGLPVVEDCAQSHGARYKGNPVGGFGEMGCFSFYPGKNLGGYGEGGAVVTNNEAYTKRIRSLRNHGSTERYYHDEVGYNMRMDGFQGAVLDIKLKYLDAWNKRRKAIAAYYRQHITNPKVVMQSQPDWADSVYHLLVICTEDRDQFMAYMQKNGVVCGMHYPMPCHLQKAYAHLQYKTGDCPNAEYLARHCVSLPMYAEMTDEQVGKVVDVINRYSNG